MRCRPHGADFEVCEAVTNTSELIQIYRRRAKRLDATGLGHGGVDQALADLEAWGAGVVRLGQVRASAEQRQFQLFLAAGADEVVACLWVHHDP